jgi:hypothetical protein
VPSLLLSGFRLATQAFGHCILLLAKGWRAFLIPVSRCKVAVVELADNSPNGFLTFPTKV